MRWDDLLAMERVVEEVNEWRHRPANVYKQDGLALVSRVSTKKQGVKQALREAVNLIGGVRKALNPGDRVLLKANFNSADPPPASTDPAFVAAVVELLREEGITDLTLGERSGWPWMPTADVMEKAGVFQLAKELDLPVINFDPGPWMDVKLDSRARWWEKIAYPKALKEFDKIVYLPCLKTHYLAGFTMSLKLAVGLTHPKEMVYMHADFRGGKPDEPMYLKMVELNLAVGPDLILMDGRKSFVTEGPAKGEMVEPATVMASGDRIALDVEGIKVLQAYPRENQLQRPVWEIPTIVRAVELGLGAGTEAEYRVVAAE